MVRRRTCAVSNHEGGVAILRDAAKRPLLRMRAECAKPYTTTLSRFAARVMPV
jgi:hypothetical protein